MKKVNLKIVIVAVLLIAAVIVGVVLLNMPKDYQSAYEKTNALTSYEMDITTIVTIEDENDTKQSVIEQSVKVYNKGKSSMRYNVSTHASSTEFSSGSVVEEDSSYMYHNGKYYQSYPGVKYKNAADSMAALENITALTNIITFAPDKMYNVTKEANDGKVVYEYGVDYADTSAYVKSTLENAVGVFDEGNFKLDSMWASATVEKDYVTERDFGIVYADGEEKSVTVEIYTKLVDTDASVEIPDESKYVSITG